MITLSYLTNIQQRSTESVKELFFMSDWLGERGEVGFEACGLCQRKGHNRDRARNFSKMLIIPGVAFCTIGLPKTSLVFSMSLKFHGWKKYRSDFYELQIVNGASLVGQQ